jgi:hypothetical protein
MRIDGACHCGYIMIEGALAPMLSIFRSCQFSLVVEWTVMGYVRRARKGLPDAYSASER